MTTSRTKSSFSSDLSHIVLLGIAFDISRFVGRAIVDVLNTKIYGHDGDNDQDQEREEIQVCRGLVETQVLTVNPLSTNGKDKENVKRMMTPRTHFLDLNKLRFHIRRLRKQFSKSIKERRFLGLYLYLVLPPPLLIYCAWDFIFSRNGRKVPTSIHNFGGFYVSSILTSCGLLSWIYRNSLQWENSDEDLYHEERENTESYNPQKLIPNLKELSYLPLQSSSSSTDNERRPRSDSLRSLMTECSMSTQTIINSFGGEKEQKKYLEILVHNVSHTDLVLGLSGYQKFVSELEDCSASISLPSDHEATPRKKNTTFNNAERDNEGDEKYIMSRPRFSAFDMFSRRVLSELQGQIESTSSAELNDAISVASRHPLHQKIISYPRYERSNSSARYTLVTPRPSDQYMLPVGFDLERSEGISNTSVDRSEMPSLRLRGRDVAKLTRFNIPPVEEHWDTQSSDLSPTPEILRINAVFFPLLATLLPRWLGRIADKFGGDDVGPKSVAAPLHSPNVKKVIVLVSGVGVPRNWTHSISGNSTQTCAELMELFIKVLYPDITVVR